MNTVQQAVFCIIISAGCFAFAGLGLYALARALWLDARDREESNG